MNTKNENRSRAENRSLRTSEEISGESQKTGLKNRIMARLAAVAFAEMGEFEAAQEMAHPAKRLQTVLLVIEGETPDLDTFNYAMRLCQRMRGEIDILQIIDINNDAKDYELLSRRMSLGSTHIVSLLQKLETEDIPFKITIRIGDINQKLFNYAKRHKDVAVVVLDSPKNKTSNGRQNVWSGLAETLSQRLSIPLVTVLDKEAPSLT